MSLNPSITDMTSTGIHHNLPAALFALRCLAYAIAHPHRKAH